MTRPMTEALIDSHDAALFDLDGVVYLGSEVVPAAPATMSRLRANGVGVGFVTNNAARATTVVADQLTDMGIPAAPSDVVSSAEAVTALVATELGQGTRVLIAATSNVDDLARQRGLVPVHSADEHPQAVIQGYDPDIEWSRLEEAAFAVQAGAHWYASNPDMTRPTDRGLVPGLGAQLAVVGACVDRKPTMAGKPARPLLEATCTRLGCHRPIFVGDRLDTDILGARNAGITSLFVLTGAHGVHDLMDADPDRRPDHIGADLGALLEPPQRVVVGGDAARCDGQLVRQIDGDLEVDLTNHDMAAQLSGVRALLELVWTGRVPVNHDALSVFDLLH